MSALGRVRRALAALGATALLAALTAATAPGLAGALRDWFDFAPAELPATAGDPLAIWLTNLRVLGLLLLAAFAARERGLVPVLDVLVSLTLGVNVAFVGLALGTYGPPLLPWLAHIPLEWSGLAVGLAAYITAREHTSGLPQIARAAAGAAALLGLAACVESWATPLALP